MTPPRLCSWSIPTVLVFLLSAADAMGDGSAGVSRSSLAFVKVETEPPGLTVLLNGKRIESGSTAESLAVKPGLVSVTVRNPCYLDAPEAFQVEAGERRVLHFEPKPRTSWLKIRVIGARSSREAAVVEVDGAAVGAAGKTLRVYSCAKKLRVVSRVGVWEQPLSLQENEVTAIAVRLLETGQGLTAPPLATAHFPEPPPPPQEPNPARGPTESISTPDSGEKGSVAAGVAILHYRRPDGDYADWGLYTWESFQKRGEGHVFEVPSGGGTLPGVGYGELIHRELPGVTSSTPLMPSGRDEFGIFWILPAKEYRNGRVNYVIQSFSSREVCADDQYFLLRRSREAWVRAGLCKVFFSKHAALQAVEK